MHMHMFISLIAIGLSSCFVAGMNLTEQTAGTVKIAVSDKHLDLLAGGQLVGRYIIDKERAKPHFHPLNGPYGKPITRAYPMIPDVPDEAKDHPHQRAVWFCHGDVIPEGMTLARKVPRVDGVDFWSEHANHGWISCIEVGKPQADGNHVWIVTKNEWQTPDREKIMDETRTLHLYELGTAKLLVFDIELLANVVPITFGDTKEGSFGVRVAETMTENRKLGGILENAEGKQTMKDCWGVKSAWCDYSGPVDGKTVGVTIFDHPKNPHPAFWHSRNYGLMAANPFGRGKAGFPDAKGRTDLVKLSKGERMKLRYGVLVHAGNAKEGKVAERFEEFVKLPFSVADARPPEVREVMLTIVNRPAQDRAAGYRLVLENQDVSLDDLGRSLRRFTQNTPSSVTHRRP